MTALATASAADGDLLLRARDGAVTSFSARVLRDACPCAACRHPVSRQRLFESREVVANATVAGVQVDGGAVAIRWHDGHASTFDVDWLFAELAAPRRPARPPRIPWAADTFPQPPAVAWDAILSSRAAERRWLHDVATHGFCIVTGVPAEDGAVARVAERFGPVHETNYGRVFDVAVRVDATNLADTSLALSLHTDNPYRAPAPTLQLLECLESDVAGGETVLADGLFAANRLREGNPAAFERLVGTPIRFAYRDSGASLATDAAVLSLGPGGEVAAIRVNNRSKGVPIGPAARADAWYDAYFAFLDLLAEPEAQLVFRLDPGWVLVFDNERVLHGRTGFAGEGRRRLQGCYAFRDALLSRLALLEET